MRTAESILHELCLPVAPRTAGTPGAGRCSRWRRWGSSACRRWGGGSVSDCRHPAPFALPGRSAPGLPGTPIPWRPKIDGALSFSQEHFTLRLRSLAGRISAAQSDSCGGWEVGLSAYAALVQPPGPRSGQGFSIYTTSPPCRRSPLRLHRTRCTEHTAPRSPLRGRRGLGAGCSSCHADHRITSISRRRECLTHQGSASVDILGGVDADVATRVMAGVNEEPALHRVFNCNVAPHGFIGGDGKEH